MNMQINVFVYAPNMSSRAEGIALLSREIYFLISCLPLASHQVTLNTENIIKYSIYEAREAQLHRIDQELSLLSALILYILATLDHINIDGMGYVVNREITVVKISLMSTLRRNLFSFFMAIYQAGSYLFLSYLTLIYPILSSLLGNYH